jgi:hypothetical protein
MSQCLHVFSESEEYNIEGVWKQNGSENICTWSRGNKQEAGVTGAFVT